MALESLFFCFFARQKKGGGGGKKGDYLLNDVRRTKGGAEREREIERKSKRQKTKNCVYLAFPLFHFVFSHSPSNCLQVLEMIPGNPTNSIARSSNQSHSPHYFQPFRIHGRDRRERKKKKKRDGKKSKKGKSPNDVSIAFFRRQQSNKRQKGKQHIRTIVKECRQKRNKIKLRRWHLSACICQFFGIRQFTE